MAWQIAAAIVSTIGALGGFAVWFFRKVVPTLRKWSRFGDRVMGVPADPATGQEEILGIFQRFDRQDEALGIIQHELFPNSGGSLRDQTNRLEQAFNEHLKVCPAPVTTTINVNPPGSVQ
jgi:hypothetical protein